MLFLYKILIVYGGFILELECGGDGIVSDFKSTIQDEKESGIKHPEEEVASLWRRCACICDGSCGRW